MLLGSRETEPIDDHLLVIFEGISRHDGFPAPRRGGIGWQRTRQAVGQGQVGGREALGYCKSAGWANVSNALCTAEAAAGPLTCRTHKHPT